MADPMEPLRLVRAAFAAALVAACDHPPPTVSVPGPTTATATASLSASAAAPDAAADDRDAWFERALVAAASCPWDDARGFGECGAKAALQKELEARQPARATALTVALLADKDARRRALGLVLRDALDDKPQAETYAAALDAALVESVPALDRSLAMAVARLPAEGADARRAKVEQLALGSKPRVRAVFLAFLSFESKDAAWVVPLITKSAVDPDAVVRLGAMRGGMTLEPAGAAGGCALWRKALGDADAEVRHAAQRSIVGSVDFVIEDDQGMLGGRAAPMRQPCAAEDVDAAVASARKDKLGDVDRAIVWAGAFRALLRAKKDVTEAEGVLVSIANDKKKSTNARTLAMRGLRASPEAKKRLASLANDPDPAVAKLAQQP